MSDLDKPFVAVISNVAAWLEIPEVIEFGVRTYQDEELATVAMTQERWIALGKPHSLSITVGE